MASQNTESIAGSIVAIVICVIVIAIWAGIAADKCKQAYGPNAELHGNRLMNECAVEGTIKPIP